MRIYDWRKFLTFIAVLLLFIALILCIHILKEEDDRTPVATEPYTVQSGETLWSIGTAYRPDNMSIQEYIYNVKEFNKIGSMIYAGQTIQLLIY